MSKDKIVWINLRVISAFSAFAALNDPTQPHLAGVSVRVTADAVTYSATNGHVAVLKIEPNDCAPDWTGEVIVPAAACKGWKFKKREVGHGFLSPNGDSHFELFQPATGTGRSFLPVVGEYPDIRRYVPTRAGEGCAQFSGHYLAMFETLAAELGAGAPFVHHNGDGPAPVTFRAVERMIGIIMPIRREAHAGSKDQSGSFVPPAFLTAPAKIAA